MYCDIRCGLLVALAAATAVSEDPLFVCSFETDALCGMEQWTNDLFNWTRRSGRTDSDNYNPTGPREARDETFYIYIDTSSPRWKGDRAYISTPAVHYSGDICVRFYYSMYGEHVGRLAVFTEQQGESQPVFEEERDQGVDWHYGMITVKNFPERDKVVFLGVVGHGYLGDIAIDYVRIHAGECDACQDHNGGCDTFCVKQVEYRFLCECNHGYHITRDDIYTCVDIDECREGNSGCSHQCLNTVGSYECRCPIGYSLAADNTTCEDINECATDNECDHLCVNVEGSYNCSCRDTFIRATDGRHCVECESAYKKAVTASQLLISECPTSSSHTGITLDDCLMEACSSQAGVVAYFNMTCDLKQCDGSHLRLRTISGANGSDIYVLDTTWQMTPRDDDPGRDDFPLVAVLVGVLAPVILLAVIVTTAVLLQRRWKRKEGSEAVHYENDPGRKATEREPYPQVIEAPSAAKLDDKIDEPAKKQHDRRNEKYENVPEEPVSLIPHVKESVPKGVSDGTLRET